jgi:hypothetical protein
MRDFITNSCTQLQASSAKCKVGNVIKHAYAMDSHLKERPAAARDRFD